MEKIRSGDKVVVMVGKDRGQQGVIEKVLPNNRLIVKGVALVRKHVKPNPMRGTAGGIETRESSIHRSNVMLVNPETGKGERVGIRVNTDGKRERFFKKTGNTVTG